MSTTLNVNLILFITPCTKFWALKNLQCCNYKVYNVVNYQIPFIDDNINYRILGYRIYQVIIVLKSGMDVIWIPLIHHDTCRLIHNKSLEMSPHRHEIPYDTKYTIEFIFPLTISSLVDGLIYVHTTTTMLVIGHFMPHLSRNINN